MNRLLASLNRLWVALKKRAGDVHDFFRPRGYVEFCLYHASGPKKGELYKRIAGRNVVTNYIDADAPGKNLSGRNLMRRLLMSSAESDAVTNNATTGVYFANIELGSGTTAETAADTSLQTPLSPSSSVKAYSSVEIDASNTYVTFVFDYAEGEVNSTIAEAGLWSNRNPGDAANGDFLARKTFGTFTKTSDYSLQIRWQIRF